MLALRRAGWGALLAALLPITHYAAYAYIVWRTLHGEFTIGDLTFLSGSFRRLRTLLENMLIGFSQVAGQALYLDDLFSFFEITPEIVSPPNPRPFPVPLRKHSLQGRRLPLSGSRALGGSGPEFHVVCG
jgi:ATP-binding cassette subfamily B protein